MTNTQINFKPVAEPGWRVQEYMIQLGEVPHTYPLAGWVIEEGRTVPAFWDQSYPAHPQLRRAVHDDQRGLVHIVLAPDEAYWSADRVAHHISDVLDDWKSERTVGRKLGLSIKDARALAHEGMARYEEFLAVPPWERDAGGFYVWLTSQEVAAG
ncbi:hypothetical protein BH11ACT3_BH11ACT3_19380 [soil metagenome]